MDFEKLAGEIEEKIDQADKILLSLHRGPDGDSIGSNLALKKILEKKDKKVSLISSSPVPQAFDYLSLEEIRHFQFTDLALDKYDLFIFLDSASWQMVNESIDDQTELPAKEKVINIDHHPTNEKFAGTNLVISSSASTAEIVYDLFRHWQVDIDEIIALYLLVGIVTDTGVFRYTNVNSQTLIKAAELIDFGADLEVISFNYLRRNQLDKLKFWGVVLENLKVDEKSKFAYSFVSYKQAKKYFDDNYPREYKSGAASMFMAGIENTQFGVIMVEEKEGKLSGSIRSRRDFDVSKIAVELGGGGHAAAAGFKLEMSFDQAVKKVLDLAKKYSTAG